MAIILPSEWPTSIGASLVSLASRIELRSETNCGIDGAVLNVLNPEPGKSKRNIVK